MSGLLLAAPSDGEELTVVSVSPGLPGFIAMFVLALVVVVLVVDMTRRVRRVQADARVQARMAEEREREHDGRGEAATEVSEGTSAGEPPADEGPGHENPAGEQHPTDGDSRRD